jgi:hypothetical protein
MFSHETLRPTGCGFNPVWCHKIFAAKCIKIRTDSGPKRLHLKGLVYHGAFHFTCCIVTNDGSVWFHDGQLGSNCQYEKNLNDFDEIELHTCGS